MSTKMQYCVDDDGNVIITFGDFILFAFMYPTSIEVHVSCCALHIVAWKSISPDIGFTSYSTFPRLSDYDEIHMPGAVTDHCNLTNHHQVKLCLTLADLCNTNCRAWSPVTDYMQQPVCKYLHQLMVY